MSSMSSTCKKLKKVSTGVTKWDNLPLLVRRLLANTSGAKLMVAMRAVERAKYIERMRELPKYKDVDINKIPPSKKTYPNTLKRFLDCLGLVWLSKWGSIEDSTIGEALKPASTKTSPAGVTCLIL
jgi:hypothetical protein